MYRVRNNASPIIAIVGGMVCVVKARLTKESTITILVNDVIITSRLGRMAKPLKMITSFTGVDQSLPALSVSIDLSMTVFKSEIEGSELFCAAFDEFPVVIVMEGFSIPSAFRSICPLPLKLSGFCAKHNPVALNIVKTNKKIFKCL